MDMKRKEFVGNLVSEIDKILLNDLKATKVDLESNYVDRALYMYKVSGVELTVMIEEEILEDKTTIICEKQEIIDTIDKKIGKSL